MSRLAAVALSLLGGPCCRVAALPSRRARRCAEIMRCAVTTCGPPVPILFRPWPAWLRRVDSLISEIFLRIDTRFFWKATTFFCKTQDFSANSSKHAGKFQGTPDPTSCTSDLHLSYPRNVPIFILYTEIWRRWGSGRQRKSV